MPRWLKWFLGGLAGVAVIGVARASSRGVSQGEQDSDASDASDAAALLAKRPGGLTIKELQLAPEALGGALALAADPVIGPVIAYASGRRTWDHQADIDVNQQGAKIAALYNQKNPDAPPMSLLAGTVQYITDVHSGKVRDAILAQLATLPDNAPSSDIVLVMRDVFNGFSDADLSHYSKHPAGYAFDFVLPDEMLDAAVDILSALPGWDKIVTDEGGIKVKHAQFTPAQSLSGLVLQEAA